MASLGGCPDRYGASPMRLGTNGGFGVRRRQKHCFKDIFALTAIHDKGLKIHCAVPDPPPAGGD